MPRLVTRVRVGPILVAVVVTGLALWMVAAAADILLLLFLAILMALYLGAVRDYFVRRLRLPATVAFWLAVLGHRWGDGRATVAPGAAGAGADPGPDRDSPRPNERAGTPGSPGRWPSCRA